MIAFVEGRLAGKTENSVVIGTAAGIGYEVFVPTYVAEHVGTIGSEVFLHTYLQVKEDGIALFGFETEEELFVFKLLITVNGIGPKGAIGILSGISLEELRFAVLTEDVKTISKTPGIGAKTAGKLILELKDKFHLEPPGKGKQIAAPKENPREASLRSEAVQALEALGYSAAGAAKALKQAEITETTTVEELIRQGLKLL